MSKKKKVQIKCEGADFLTIDEMEEFQGELKKITEKNYIKLRNNIERLGFSSPIHIWRKGDKKYIIDGHQRLLTLKKMMLEGYEVPKLPVVWVEAKTKKEAKEKVLSLVSVYGEVTEKSLKDYLLDSDLDVKEVLENFHEPTINIDKLYKELELDSVDNSLPEDNIDKEIKKLEKSVKEDEEEGGTSYITHVCPKCGHQFNSKSVKVKKKKKVH